MISAWSGFARRFAALARTDTRPVRLRWVAFAVPGLALLAGQPADFFAPQFNAEEGSVFFEQAYNEGFLSSLFSSEAGYYHLTLRLTAELALLVPLEYAPLVFKIVSFAIQMLPVAYLLADGVVGFVAAPLLRIAAAALYVAGPNLSEIYLNVNNSQWHLTLAACLIMLSTPRRGAAKRALDTGVLILPGARHRDAPGRGLGARSHAHPSARARPADGIHAAPRPLTGGREKTRRCGLRTPRTHGIIPRMCATRLRGRATGLGIPPTRRGTRGCAKARRTRLGAKAC